MKVVTGETMQQMDRRTIDEFGIAGLTLMEQAGRCCAEAIMEAYGASGLTAVVVAGKGNNGGDGFVIARLLQDAGWLVRVFILCTEADIAGDAAINLRKVDANLCTYCSQVGELQRHYSCLAGADVIIDAILGTGLTSEVRGVYGDAIELINSLDKPVFAVDIPSGVDAATGKVLGRAIRADLTVTFAAAKIGAVLHPGAELCGTLKVVDIGIPPQVIVAAPGHEFVDEDAAAHLIRRRTPMTHKGQCGHCLIIAGSTGKSGAAAMSANSAVRAGAGLVTIAVPASLNHIMEIKTTEAMSVPLDDGGHGFIGAEALEAILSCSAGKDVLAIGPGLSLDNATTDLVRRVLTDSVLPLVMDADALNAISQDPDLLLSKKAPFAILTPHPGEMARLAGLSVADVEQDRIAVAKSFSSRYNVFLILKGARTVISSPDGDLAINGSGNPGMATGGMGDVLTGTLAALVGQGYAPFTACRLAVFIHGLAADLVAADKGDIGISAVDVQEALPYAFKKISEKIDSCHRLRR